VELKLSALRQITSVFYLMSVLQAQEDSPVVCFEREAIVLSPIQFEREPYTATSGKVWGEGTLIYPLQEPIQIPLRLTSQYSHLTHCKKKKAVSPGPIEEKCCYFPLKSYFLAHGGFRCDKVTCTSGILFPNNFEMLDDTLRAKHLLIYEAGGKALLAFDANWYLKGFYSYGWITSGTFSNPPISGKLGGFTQDALAGLGYLFTINPSCSLGVLGGWGFDEQETRLKNANPSQFGNLEFQSIWNGPWLGLDFFAWKQSRMKVNLGYEFHWTNWSGAWTLEQELPTAFSDCRKAGMSFGQVAYFDLRWDSCLSNWRVDLEFKYQNWSTQSSGYLNSRQMAEFGSAPIVGPVSAITFIKEATWVSYGVSLNIGYSF